MMGSLSIWHWLILLAVVALLFGGRGKLSGIMGDAAKGIKAFKEGLKDDEHSTVHSVEPTAGTLPRTDAAARAAEVREREEPRV